MLPGESIYPDGSARRDHVRDAQATTVAPEVAHVLRDVLRFVQAAGKRRAAVAFAQPDHQERLEIVWRQGDVGEETATPARRRRSAYVGRRSAYVGRRSSIVQLDRSDRGIAFVPVIVRDDAVGVVEVVAAVAVLETELPALEFAADLLGATLRGRVEHNRLRSEIDLLEDANVLGIRLARARTAAIAVDLALRFLARHLQTSATAWFETDGVTRLASVGADGSDKGDAISDVAPAGAAGVSNEQPSGVPAGDEEITIRSAGGALLVVKARGPFISRTLGIVSSILAEVLPSLNQTPSLRRQQDQLEMGLAWTAHELRAPLVGVRAALDILTNRLDAEPRLSAIAASSARELDRAIGTADALLASAVGGEALDRRPTDLVALIRDIAGSCARGLDDGEILVDAPDQLVLDLDEDLARAAVSNVVRNAMAYRTPGTQVGIRVRVRGNAVLVAVSDDGPPIPADEVARIFDPFVRGGYMGGGHRGNGLGLFITKGVAQAHGGSVWVESDASAGTTFWISFPRERGNADPRHDR